LQKNISPKNEKELEESANEKEKTQSILFLLAAQPEVAENKKKAGRGRFKKVKYSLLP
jgi:hypothetical protein